MADPKNVPFKDEMLKAREQRFSAQCYLMHHLNLAGIYKPGKNFKYFSCIDDQPAAFLGRITRRSEAELFLERVKPHQLSALVPKIRIFKVRREGGKVIESEIHFDDHLSKEEITSITSSRSGRGSGVGLRNVSWEYDGRNPAESTRFIKVKMKVFFRKIEDLMRGHGGGTTFLDLIKPSVKKDRSSSAYSSLCIGGSQQITDLDPNAHQIRLEVGWAVPSASHMLFKNENKLREAIANATVSLHLTLVQHNLNFQQDGRVELDVDFWGHAEGNLESTQFDVLNTKADACKALSAALMKTKKNQRAVRQRMNTIGCMSKKGKLSKEDINWIRNQKGILASKMVKKGKIDSNAKEKFEKRSTENIKRVLKERIALLEDYKLKRYESIVMGLFKKGSIRFVNVPPEVLNILDSGTWRRTPGTGKSSGTNRCGSGIGVLKDKNKMAKYKAPPKKGGLTSFYKNTLMKKKLATSADKCKTIYFFSLGDLFDVVLENFYKPDGANYSSMSHYKRFLFGQIERRDDNADGKTMSLADLPISLDRFSVWFTNQIVRRGKVTYGFTDFMKDLIVKLIAPILNDICLRQPGDSEASKSKETKIYPRIVPITIPALTNDGKDPLLGISKAGIENSNGIKRMKKTSLPKRPSALKSSTGKPMYTYYCIFATEERKHYRTVDYRRDIKDGIYHFNIGMDTGLIKEITFSQNNQAYLKEAVAQGTGIAWTKRLYDANIKMYGNSIFVPGMKVFINPVTIGLGNPSKNESLASQMGLGGYYVIIKVAHLIETGRFETTLTCKWESKGNGIGYNTNPGTGGGSTSCIPKK